MVIAVIGLEERWEQKMEVLYYLFKMRENSPLKRVEQVTPEALGFRRCLRIQDSLDHV